MRTDRGWIASFERALRAWLDQPRSERLRAELERLAAKLCALPRSQEAWARIRDLLRPAACPPAGVEWDRLRSRILRHVLATGQLRRVGRARASRSGHGRRRRAGNPRGAAEGGRGS